MKIVYFNPELSARAPDLLGVFCADPSGRWIAPEDIGAALEAGEDVEIRQASCAEIERAEGIVILYGIEMKLANQIGALLDPSEPIEPSEAIEASDAIEAIEALGAPWPIAAAALAAGEQAN